MTLLFQILLVEDDNTAVELVREALKDSGIIHDLTVASDGEAALLHTKMSPQKPHLIFLDLNLPKKSGLEVLKELKRTSGLSHIPVIMLTNSRSQDDVARAYGHHCNAYVRKPLGFDMLVDTIKATGRFWLDIATLPEKAPTPSSPSSLK